MEEMLQTAIRASKAGGKISHSYFKEKIKVETKNDSSPVTKADQECEKEIRRIIEKKYPRHQILGEEYGETERESEFRWIIDPIDGTLQFIRGLPFWGSVLGLEYQGQMIIGVIHHPVLKLTIWASKSGGCFANSKQVRCTRLQHLHKATVVYSGIRRSTPEHRESLFRVLDQVYDDRGLGDCYGHSLVIQGYADAMIDLKVAAHDISGIKLCVEEAGGHFSSLDGIDSITAGSALSCSKGIAGAIIKEFARN